MNGVWNAKAAIKAIDVAVGTVRKSIAIVPAR